MPFPYQASATPVRTREPLRRREKDREKEKERDKDARSTTSSSTRKHREASRSSNRSPLPSSSRPASLYTQTNVTLDQLPPLPRSETASPSSLRSPTFRASTGPSSTSTPLSSSAHLYTPAALRPYLETDDDEDFDNAKTPQASSTVQTRPYFDPEVAEEPSKPESTPTTSPISPTALTDITVKTPSPREFSTSPLALSRVNTRQSDPTPSLQHPRPFHFSASPAFTHPLPYLGAPPNEPYIPHLPPGPQYFPMGQPPNHPLDLHSLPPQNYYQPYGSAPHMPPPFNPLRSPPAREYSSTSSRLSFSGEPPHAMGPMPTMPTEPGPPPPESAPPTAPEAEEDAVLQRIQSAIPDLHLLLNRYRETSGQLGERELTLRHTEAEKTKIMEQKDSYIERLARERDEALHKHREENNKHAEEKSKMRLEIGNMTEQHNELHENLQTGMKVRENLEKALHDSQAKYALLVAEHSSEKAAFVREHESLKSAMSNDLADMEQDLRRKEGEFTERLQQQSRELEALFQSRITELEQEHRKEKEALESSWLKHRRELEDTSIKLRRDLDDTKSAQSKALDEHLKRFNQEKEDWVLERQSLMKEWENERAKAGQGSAELHSQHQKEKEEMQKSWKSSQSRTEKEHAAAIAKIQAELDRVKAGWEADTASFGKVKAELKATASKLNTENTKLQKLADALEAFGALWQQISALAEDFCSDCPIQIPSEVARSIPSSIPHFLVDTPASGRIRVAYVQSLISNIITRRIFQPFLFTHEDLDDTFNEWAEYLRRKSTKREAVWRQRTLHAAFSCRTSKEKINRFAGQIIDDIVTTVKPFVDRSKRAEMITAVKQIVKTAAETWRYARIELPKITAAPATEMSRGDEEQLLSIFPRIEREPLPNDFSQVAQEDMGCVYSSGQTLSKRSSAVFARRVELGEVVPPPVAAAGQQERSDVRPEWRRPRKMSSEIANRARKFEPRSISPLIPEQGSTHSSKSKSKATTVSDELSDIQFGEQHEQYGGDWDAHTRRSDDEGFTESQEEVKDMQDEGWAMGEAEPPAAASSPLPSPAHSPTGSPPLSRQSTGTADSLSEDDEASGASEVTEKPGTVPDRETAGAHIPGGW
ncbi:MAG: hypothetical protein Q9208_008208 [Pyrenodesmia sp. 3 TL-2023]